MTTKGFTTDLLSGVVVGVILVPTAMAYGIIAGVGPAAGLYGAIVIGFLAAITGNTRAFISGPNVFVAIVLAPVVADHGLEAAFTAALLAGIFLLALSVLRLGRFIAYIPHSLLSGFFSAAGILLIVTQVLPALGLPTAPGGIVGNVKEWPSAVVNYDALAVAVVTIAIGILWPGKLAKYAPGQFIALVVGTSAGVLWFDDAPVIGDIPNTLPDLTLPIIETAVITPAFTMALLSGATTLLTALQTDSITGARHSPNRELMAQGIGNVAAGLIGGCPGGVSSTTLINAHAGGRSIIAALTSVSVLVLSLIALPADHIPLAALSGIIIVNGYRIIDWRYLRRLRQIPVSYAFVMLTTVAVAVLVDFVTAILIGLVVAALVSATRSEQHELKRLMSVPLPDSAIWPDGDPFGSRVALVILPDWVSVASAREMARVLKGEVRDSEAVIFDFNKTAFVDDTAAALIAQVISGKPAIVVGMQGDAAAMLSGFGYRQGTLAADLEQAKQLVRELL